MFIGIKHLVRNMRHIAPKDEKIHQPREEECGCAYVLAVFPNCMDTVGEGLSPRRNSHIHELEVLNRFLERFKELDKILVEGKKTHAVGTPGRIPPKQ
jgi:hypothetical protein